jgi:hypothetical protein
MDRPAQNHRDPWFNPFFSQILQDTKLIFGTKHAQAFIFPGTGTGGWEVALTNTLSPGKHPVVLSSGTVCAISLKGMGNALCKNIMAEAMLGHTKTQPIVSS